MDIATSEVYESSVQDKAGRREVMEKYVLTDGRELTFFWIGAQPVEAVVEARKVAIRAAIQERLAAQAFVGTLRLPLTKLEFRRLFTLEERMVIDSFNAGADANPALPENVRAAIRTMKEDMAQAQNILLDDPDTIAGLNLYAQLGLISPQRLQEILNG